MANPNWDQTYEAQLDADVDNWIKQANYIPKNINYDWRPFCRALIENHRFAGGLFPDPTPDPPPPSPKKNTKRNRPKDVLKGIQPGEQPLLAPNLGQSYTHVRYIPAWMDPDYKEHMITAPAGEEMRNMVRDAVYNLRPALRLNDQFRNPTDYALRFGFAADRQDGRSRMSPTWSLTRKPTPNFWDQIGALSEENRQLALNMSLEKWKEMGQEPPPGLEILPGVMEEFLNKHGLMAGVNLGSPNKGANKGAKKGRSLEELLLSAEPGVLSAHQSFLENLLDDQDYQRVLFSGMTTDELVQNNIHTMSNDVVMDLDNPIHHLFTRNHWEEGRYKGRRARNPRQLYNVNGTREEYNVTKNDTLWVALQPALQLVSMVLSKKPPHLDAIMNMNTRQPIHENENNADPNNVLPTLTKYVLEKDIDMNLTYPILRELHETYNYDWKGNVLRVLEHILVLEIDSAFTLSEGYDMTTNVAHDPHKYFSYGSAGMYRRDGHPTSSYGQPDIVRPDLVIKIKLAAEIVWPLLIPQYSKSEKMACSFLIATTLLHELTHAISQAQELLTKRSFQPPGQDPRIGMLLRSLRGTIWDEASVEHQEPFFYDNGMDELGHDFEQSLWGCAIALTGDDEGLSRHHHGLPFVLGEVTHPLRRRGDKADVVYPGLRYIRPIPLDYMTKFFTTAFWNEEFEAYGFGALKIKPDQFPQKTIIYQPRLPDRDIQTLLYGEEKSSFIDAVPKILKKSRQYVLSTYLNSLTMRIVWEVQFQRWWIAEAGNWSEGLLHPLQGSVDLLDIEIKKTRELDLWHRGTIPGQVMHHEHYLKTKKPDDPDLMTFPQWQADVGAKWHEMVRYGGVLMQRLLVVHNNMQDDIGSLQRMTFYYLASKQPNVTILLRTEDGLLTMAGVIHGRLEVYKGHATRIAEVLEFFSKVPALLAIKSRWKRWEARMRSNADRYAEMMDMLEDAAHFMHKPFDAFQKARLERLPTGTWKHPPEILAKMAQREYTRADPAVRKTIDDFLQNYTSINSLQATQVTVNEIGETLQQMTDIGGITTGSGRPTVFDFHHPSSQNRPPPPPPTPRPVYPTLEAVSIPTSASVFGVPGITGPGLMQTTEGETPPRRITRAQKPQNAAERSSAYRNYMSNLLSTVVASGKKADFFKTAVPQPIADLLPSQKQLAPGSGRLPIKPFPNPYAGRRVRTSVDAVFQARKEARNKDRQAQNKAKGVYVSPRLWRETGEDDVEMTDVEDA